MISLNVASREEVDRLIERVEANGGQIADRSTDATAFMEQVLRALMGIILM
ncbi:TPA: hypothetical protein U1B14_001375 [Streptococcus suis]|uniref:hypothetical protein n=1 Tax=Streptococcus suis TaxID=1307 RepID=UPI000768BC17|nr:hypothetical protein [Streptococcus suis]MBM7193203.1 hypothetical protein [Streptococcus suis]MBY4635510.1 hypothetical protein [Streptococcus suis]MCO8207732.1 hypothetical protein [Streptococcus suis]MCO8212106.1 hypothetical protein [Streptococcus suis]MCO8225498.1 hypothetical protein [Streptococcus suis]